MTENIQNTALIQTETTEQLEKLPKLRPRLIKFCEGIIQGKSQVESYKLAGFKVKNDNVASVYASRLLELSKIKTYINIRENQERIKLEIQTNVSRAWVMNVLMGVIERCTIDKKEREVIAASAEINRMQGYLAPTKTESTVINKHKVDINSLSADDYTAMTNKFKGIEEGLRKAKLLANSPKIETVDAESVGSVMKVDNVQDVAHAEIEPETQTQPEANNNSSQYTDKENQCPLVPNAIRPPSGD